MKNFHALLADISITKILNFFGFRITLATNKYNYYTAIGSSEAYYVFNDSETDSLQLFSQKLYRKITRSELLFFASGSYSLHSAISFLSKISDHQAQDTNANISEAVSVNTLTNLIAALIEPDTEILPITKTPQFKRRIFLTADGFFKTPLFHYHLNNGSSKRIVNFVRWNDTETHYFNNNSYCLNASFYNASNKYLFLTCSPKAWTSFPLKNYSPDYFQILCHADAPLTMHVLLYNIFKKYNFLKCFFHIGNDITTNRFSCKVLAAFLNQFSDNFQFDINYSSDRYFVQITYYDKRELNIQIAKLFTNVSYELNENFFLGQQNDYELSDIISNLPSIESDKVVIGEKISVIESIAAQSGMAVLFFNSLLKHLKLDSKLEVIAL